MHNLFNILYISGLLLLLNACVTTRSELNERGASNGFNTAPSTSVKSEAIHADNQATVESPKVVQSAAPAVAANQQGSYQVDELRAQVAELTGKVEELQHDQGVKDAAHSEETKLLQAKIEILEKKLKANEGPALPEGKDSFEAGKDAYFSGHYAEAVEFLDAYLKTENPKSLEEATYIRGESHFQLKNYKKAIVDFSTFPEKFQKSSYHPKALLRISESFEQMGRKEDAKAFYSDLVEKFPKTAEGKLAKKRLNKK